jgi:hypothetical protein
MWPGRLQHVEADPICAVTAALRRTWNRSNVEVDTFSDATGRRSAALTGEGSPMFATSPAPVNRALRLMTATAMVGAVFAAAGCGGGSGADADTSAEGQSPTSTRAAETPTKATYIKQVDAVCVGRRPGSKPITVAIGKASVDLNAALASGANTDRILDRIGRLHVRLVERREESLRLMRAVTPPEDGGATLFFDQFDRTTDMLRRFAEATPKMDGSWKGWLTRFNKQANTISRATAISRKRARAYGIKQCETTPVRNK